MLQRQFKIVKTKSIFEKDLKSTEKNAAVTFLFKSHPTGQICLLKQFNKMLASSQGKQKRVMSPIILVYLFCQAQTSPFMYFILKQKKQEMFQHFNSTQYIFLALFMTLSVKYCPISFKEYFLGWNNQNIRVLKLKDITKRLLGDGGMSQ